MFIGWVTSSLAMVLLLLGSNLDRVQQGYTYYENDQNKNGGGGGGTAEQSSFEFQPAKDAPSIPFLSLTVSTDMADVCKLQFIALPIILPL